MKQAKLLAILILFLLLMGTTLAEEITLELGEEKTFESSSIKLKNLKSDKAVISVNGDSKILTVGEEDEINVLIVKLIDIFYASESDGNVKVQVSSLYTCGDNACEGPETQENCCKDCGCTFGYDCITNECQAHVDHECNKDEDCNDHNEVTLDKCTGSPRKCQYIDTSICKEDVDCADDNPCTKDVCRNNDCFNEEIEDCAAEPELEVKEPEFEETINEESEQETTTGEPLEKLSIIQRILNFFKNLF